MIINKMRWKFKKKFHYDVDAEFFTYFSIKGYRCEKFFRSSIKNFFPALFSTFVSSREKSKLIKSLLNFKIKLAQMKKNSIENTLSMIFLNVKGVVH